MLESLMVLSAILAAGCFFVWWMGRCDTKEEIEKLNHKHALRIAEIEAEHQAEIKANSKESEEEKENKKGEDSPANA